MITADGDCVSTSAYLQIEDGSFMITTGEDSTSVTITTDTVDSGQQGGFQDLITSTTEDDSVGQKGISDW